jgi:hypothetical protein
MVGTATAPRFWLHDAQERISFVSAIAPPPQLDPRSLDEHIPVRILYCWASPANAQVDAIGTQGWLPGASPRLRWGYHWLLANLASYRKPRAPC